MSDLAIIKTSTLQGIANAIRSKKGTSSSIPTTSMASEISSISTGIEEEVIHNVAPSSTKLIQFNVGTKYTKLHNFYMVCSNLTSSNQGIHYLFDEDGIAYALMEYNWKQLYSTENPPITFSNGIITVYLSGYEATLSSSDSYTATIYVS